LAQKAGAKAGDGGKPPPLGRGGSGDGVGAAKVLFFHGHAAAAAADEFHGLKLVFANVLRFGVRFSAKAALGLVVARIAQMARRFRDRAAILAGICHGECSFPADEALPVEN
jgi:hypothetical protein